MWEEGYAAQWDETGMNKIIIKRKKDFDVFQNLQTESKYLCHCVRKNKDEDTKENRG